MFIKAYAEPASGRNGVNGRAANGQSLRRRRGETMGEYYRRTGEAVKSKSANRSIPKNWSKDKPNYLANGNVVVWDGSRFLTVRGRNATDNSYYRSYGRTSRGADVLFD